MENFEYLQGCEVIWKKKLASSTECADRDDLKLNAKELWINDRVYATDGTMIIGNVEGVPYKLLRQQEEQD